MRANLAYVTDMRKPKVEHEPIHLTHRWRWSDGRRRQASLTFSLQWIRCGKPACELWHGPYWYAYWKEEGRNRSRYLGRNLPAFVVEAFREASASEEMTAVESRRLNSERKRRRAS
jgi:hypothetical protein